MFALSGWVNNKFPGLLNARPATPPAGAHTFYYTACAVTVCLVPHFSTSFPLHASIAWDTDQDNINTGQNLAVNYIHRFEHDQPHSQLKAARKGFLSHLARSATPGRRHTMKSAKPVQIMGSHCNGRNLHRALLQRFYKLLSFV